MGIGKGKPLFVAAHAVIWIGIVLSGFFVVSSFFSSSWTTSAVSEAICSATSAASAKKPLVNQWEKDIWDVPPAGSKMPPLKSFSLTKELVEHRVKDNVLVVTFGNYGVVEFILNWVKHLTDLNVTNLLVGAMDIKLLGALYWKGIPVYDMDSQMTTVDVGWGTAEFNKMGREKVFLINSLLPFGYELLVCDSDTVWLKNPLPYLARFPEADILSSTDSLVPTVTDDSLEDWDKVARGSLNIGMFHWRPSNSTKTLAKEWKDLLLSDDKQWDQDGFNKLVYKVYGPSVEGNEGLVYAFDGKLKLGILPVAIFCSGHTYFIQDQHHQLKVEPYSVHTSFQFGGAPGKRHRLRERMLFYDPPEYYNSPDGFLSFKPHIPKSLLMDGAHILESHFSLVNYQLKQIRTALSIALLLKRVLVMPPLWCRFDNIWFGHPGVLPGTMTRQPFICPLDHVFRIGYMLSELPEESFGPKINFREYSFFNNPRFPKEILSSHLEVELCEEGCEGQAINHKLRKLRLPKNSSEEMLVNVLSAHSHIKVLEFSSMQDAFRGFSSQETQRKFRKRVQAYMERWCCLENVTRGHIYYDMYWDEKPGWEPKPPQSEEEDHYST